MRTLLGFIGRLAVWVGAALFWASIGFFIQVYIGGAMYRFAAVVLTPEHRHAHQLWLAAVTTLFALAGPLLPFPTKTKMVHGALGYFMASLVLSLWSAQAFWSALGLGLTIIMAATIFSSQRQKDLTPRK